jgi:deoxycytidylate deaminase
MQIAYNAKANSGCISRQVGAVITDKNHSVKSIGWNDVAANQIPCNLRNLKDLVLDVNQEHFSDFEKGIEGNYDDGESFKSKATNELKSINLNNLNGKNCSFCFKTFHNVFEGKSNQVHTRSLHAEENAMLQLTKYGGQGVENGILYTTASPCELCSKKAFQLGISQIIYIDPYPGIATTHILKSGKTASTNPILKMFRGAVGSTFHKLYEPVIAYKDELNILSGVHPKMDQSRVIQKLTDDKSKQEKIRKILED